MSIEEIRTACAEACGWTHHRKVSKDFDYWTDPSGKEYMNWATPKDVPNYPTDLNAAFTLCDVLKKEGWKVDIIDWSVIAYTAELDFEAENTSLALDICEVFLKAKGLWK
jgi:hypothetical protein